MILSSMSQQCLREFVIEINIRVSSKQGTNDVSHMTLVSPGAAIEEV